MSGKANRPPAGEPWAWLTRDLLASDAWRSQGINTRRFIDFLLLEHMSKGGGENGNLKAPRRQLEEFGIGARFISDAISDAEVLGLVHCQRGGMRIATTYRLGWLPHRDGTPATDKWRNYRNPALAVVPVSKSANLTDKGKSGLVHKGKSDAPNLTNQGKSDCPESLVYKGKHPSRTSSYHGETEQERRESGAVGDGPGAVRTHAADGRLDVAPPGTTPVQP
jgi:hypothetical protein